jgi:FlaA1/EpsC-like NDP-sugar epimerase
MNLETNYQLKKLIAKAVRISQSRYSPRWIIFLLDVLILSFSLYITYFILSMLGVKPIPTYSFSTKLLLLVGINAVFMFGLKTYAGVIRHSRFQDLFKLFISIFCTVSVFLIINFIHQNYRGEFIIRNPVLFFYAVISFGLLFFFRLSIQGIYKLINDANRSKYVKKILVLGTNDEAISFASAIKSNINSPYEVAGFLVNKKENSSTKILGKNIYSKNCLTTEFVKENNFEAVLLQKESLTRTELNAWVNFLIDSGLKVLKVPSIQKFREKDLIGGIQQIQIEDLLNRKSISMGHKEVEENLAGKKVLVTGGAGSIGSEIVRQVAKHSPSMIVVLDQAETPLYSLELELKDSSPNIRIHYVLGDISNSYRMEKLFVKYQFDVVYHAAAYKHVPMIEENPHESIFVNIHGTKILASYASKYKVERFVMVSTDKAVNPTNVMGASKRVAELYVQALQKEACNQTKFITTRFGNVLGSNGSVIPHFKKQIQNGGPVTITHPEIVRYFMTIPEACELVLQAGTMGNGGEIYVFDMGKPVKILDLATRMIKLYGLEPHLDIPISYTGLRPGEKLYEELLSDDTTTIPTAHKQILISKDPTRGFSEIDYLTKNIIKAAMRRDKMEVVKQLKSIVPEFKSNNSIYQSLD